MGCLIIIGILNPSLGYPTGGAVYPAAPDPPGIALFPWIRGWEHRRSSGGGVGASSGIWESHIPIPDPKTKRFHPQDGIFTPKMGFSPPVRDFHPQFGIFTPKSRVLLPLWDLQSGIGCSGWGIPGPPAPSSSHRHRDAFPEDFWDFPSCRAVPPEQGWEIPTIPAPSLPR